MVVYVWFDGLWLWCSRCRVLVIVELLTLAAMERTKFRVVFEGVGQFRVKWGQYRWNIYLNRHRSIPCSLLIKLMSNFAINFRNKTP